LLRGVAIKMKDNTVGTGLGHVLHAIVVFKSVCVQ
jgi:hypothetical protein